MFSTFPFVFGFLIRCGKQQIFTHVTVNVVLNSLSMTSRLSDFTRGIIDTSHLVYFLSLIAIFIFLTIRSLETRRWR